MRLLSGIRRGFAVALLVLSTAAILPRLAVVCVAPGGHVAIEPGRGTCDDRTDKEHHDPLAPAHTEAIAAVGSCDDAPGAPCSDVPLDAQAWIRAAATASADPLLVPADGVVGPAAQVQECALSSASRIHLRHCAVALPVLGNAPTVLRC